MIMTMLNSIPSNILNAYQPASFLDNLYLKMRWRLCPYELIESFTPKNGKILDFGCGYGLLTNLLTLDNKSRTLIGIDTDTERIRKAKRSSINRNNISFHAMNIEKLTESNFDAIVMTDVLHHIHTMDVLRLFTIFIHHLNDQGVIVILDVDRSPFWKYCIAHSIDRLLNPTSSLYYRSVTDMKQLLSIFPLKIEKIIRADKNIPLSDIIYICKKV